MQLLVSLQRVGVVWRGGVPPESTACLGNPGSRGRLPRRQLQSYTAQVDPCGTLGYSRRMSRSFSRRRPGPLLCCWSSADLTHSRRKATAPSQSLLRRFNRAATQGVRVITESPWMKFTTGVVLLTSGLDEAIDTLFADLSALELGAHHGVMLLGFVNVFSSLPDMLDGLVGTFLVEEDEEEQEQVDAHDEGNPKPARQMVASNPGCEEQDPRMAA
jgi:hypothetical protein